MSANATTRGRNGGQETPTVATSTDGHPDTSQAVTSRFETVGDRTAWFCLECPEWQAQLSQTEARDQARHHTTDHHPQLNEETSC